MNRHRAVVCLVLLLAGSCAKQKDPRTEAKPSTPAVDKAGALIASAPAGQTLAALRARFTIERADAATSLDDSDTPKTWSPLLPDVATKFAIADGGLAPVGTTSVAAHPARLLLPTRSNGFFRIEDVDSGMVAEIRMHDLRDVAAESAGGYLVFPQAP